ncbi:MAG: hypothetical protein AAGH89_08205, partial [Verrucomicrobiota bacterium]
TADGKNLYRIAQGFWNPFGVCVRDDGEIFAAENDPGARPPCRLIHVVEGGDYGYQRRYGRSPFHPFVAWNGELRGTLPMIHATGEAPCAILPLGGGVMVPSWSDNRIDFFPLEPMGASYTSKRIELVRGSTHFRPTCFAEAEDGSFYFTDWVFTAYTLHQRGRLWKLEIDRKSEWLKPAKPAKAEGGMILAQELRNGAPAKSLTDVLSLARSEDPFLARAALMELARRSELHDLNWVSQLGEADRINAVLAAKLSDVDRSTWVRTALADSSDDVRFEALRWIADEDLSAFRSDIDEIFLEDSLDYQLFEACLAAANTLDGNPRAGVADAKMLMERIRDRNITAQVRAYALRLFPAKEKSLKLPMLEELIALGHEPLTFEAIRSLNAKNSKEARSILATLAIDKTLSVRNRAEAVLGLAADPSSHSGLLAKLQKSQHVTIRDEARRASPNMPVKFAGIPPFTDTVAWQNRIDSAPGKADLETGRRLFFHPRLTRCHTCHRHSGRGAVVGPDLSAVADRSDPTWLLQSILEPSREVAPQYYPWQLGLTDGTTFTGIALRQGGNSGKEFYRDITGAEQSFVKADIDHRQELQTSLMPGGLILALSPAELRDLVAFLSE